jgi:hypothetical protein
MHLEIREHSKPGGVKAYGVWDTESESWLEGVEPIHTKSALQGPVLRVQLNHCASIAGTGANEISKCHIEVHEIAMHFPEWLKLHEKK